MTDKVKPVLRVIAGGGRSGVTDKVKPVLRVIAGGGKPAEDDIPVTVEPNAKLVDLLAKHLDMARTGEMTGAIIIATYADDTCSHEGAGPVLTETLLGEVVKLQHRLTVALVEADDED